VPPPPPPPDKESVRIATFVSGHPRTGSKMDTSLSRSIRIYPQINASTPYGCTLLDHVVCEPSRPLFPPPKYRRLCRIDTRIHPQIKAGTVDGSTLIEQANCEPSRPLLPIPTYRHLMMDADCDVLLVFDPLRPTH